MVTGGTLFPHTNIHKGIWLGPDDRIMDHIVML
jgi:hypothetical protein